MKITTNFVHPPIPPREYDWSAMFDCDDGDSGRIGYGRDEQEAALDLIDAHYEALVGIALDEFDAYAADAFNAPLRVKVAQFNELKDTMALLRIADNVNKSAERVIPSDLIQNSYRKSA